MTVWIELSPEHINFADELAQKRRGAAVKRGRAPKNNATENHEEALALDRLGARCECAGYLWAKPVKWNTFAIQVGGLADLHDFIDVKGRPESWHDMIVQKDDENHWAYLAVYAHAHPRYLIHGWLWGHEAKLEEFWKDPKGGRPAFFVPRKQVVRDPALLLAILRDRQGGERPAELIPTVSCEMCSQRGEYGYRDGSRLRWYCGSHRLSEYFADAKR